ncbi:MAG: extracellular solute-binding protein [Christensenellales bacterium]
MTDDGAIYTLPATYNCDGITYNKTLMEKHGWTLPKTFAELEALAEKAKAARVRPRDIHRFSIPAPASSISAILRRRASSARLREYSGRRTI